MNKKLLFILVIPAVFLLSNCKKDKATTTDTTTYILQAYIGGNLWAPDTLSASINYTAASNKRVFSFSGQKTQKKITASVTDPTPSNSDDFTLGTYKVDSAATVAIKYYVQTKDGSGNYVFTQYGAVEPGSGTVTITAVDTDKKTITGTYSFTSRKINYDGSGNIISIDVANVASGAFNALPYTFAAK
ncbi:hypothetical protein FFF34_004690 [Inquilinus sp. KBS0705]|nr:hypothetical protein FFF34_004690 [Inquilinus sp. KBS0705]